MRILVADDHLIVRLGIRALLEDEPDIEVVGEATNGSDAVRLALTLRPDVILMDLVMPRKDGVAATREICQAMPNARILILTSYIDDEKLVGAIQAGALGYTLKDASPLELFSAIRAVGQGQRVLSGEVGLRLLHKLRESSRPEGAEAQLTARELEVVKLAARGLTNREIAEKLSITERTAGVHISRIIGKLGLANRTQLAIYALQRGIVTADKAEADQTAT